MKKILIILLVIISIFAIYIFTSKKHNMTFAIGLTNSDINYNPESYKITDIIIDIENNIDIDGYAIQNLLVRSNNITINLNKYIKLKDYETIISQLSDLETLLKLIRKYSKEKITIKLLEEKNILYEYANKKIILLSEKYDIIILR